jgi:hypothetical protein
MLGAIIGDIVGSRFEWNNINTKEFELFNYRCEFTDDSVMSLAVAKRRRPCLPLTKIWKTLSSLMRMIGSIIIALFYVFIK